jgi:predicted RNA-binding Zn-ribbon protein involved in translation (DUF1610 family)
MKKRKKRKNKFKAWIIVWKDKEINGLPDIVRYNLEAPLCIFNKKEYAERWIIEKMKNLLAKKVEIYQAEVHFRRKRRKKKICILCGKEIKKGQDYSSWFNKQLGKTIYKHLKCYKKSQKKVKKIFEMWQPK